MPSADRLVVFVHGWSVRSTETYGELPARLKREAARAAGLRLDVRNIFLGRYVSFRDEVRMEDVSRAFAAALQEEVGAELRSGRRFVCITHSTGGPVVRDWWHRFHMKEGSSPCPMSHLVMLAPANFGAALAQVGKSRISRIKTWFEGVEPGSGLLDWLELGSPESWEFNQGWIGTADPTQGRSPVFPFVLTGQSIDRALYDHLNSYTDEGGSDGVVRAAAANLNTASVRLTQQPPVEFNERARRLRPTRLVLSAQPSHSPPTAFALVAGRSHSGKTMGILRSVTDDGAEHPTVTAVLRCLLVTSAAGYKALREEFDRENDVLVEAERVEIQKRRLLPDRAYIHDKHAMVIFRVRDDAGHTVTDFDLKLTAGQGGKVSADLLPSGFLTDRQKNRRDGGTLTFYFNYDAMVGSPAVLDPRDRTGGTVLRAALPGAESLGLELTARPDEGFVHYFPATLAASKETLSAFIRPHRTTMVEIVLKRVVRSGTFRLTRDLKPSDFTGQPAGPPVP